MAQPRQFLGEVSNPRTGSNNYMSKTRTSKEPATTGTYVRFEWERALRESSLDAHAKAMALILATNGMETRLLVVSATDAPEHWAEKWRAT
jgi:hypothetical protein